MSLICFSSINFFPSIPHPINQICCCACNSLWRRGLWPYAVNAAEPFNLHRLKFYVCCSFLLFSSAKNYLGYKTKTQVHFFLNVCVYTHTHTHTHTHTRHTHIYMTTRFLVPFPKFSKRGGTEPHVVCGQRGFDRAVHVCGGRRFPCGTYGASDGFNRNSRKR